MPTSSRSRRSASAAQVREPLTDEPLQDEPPTRDARPRFPRAPTRGSRSRHRNKRTVLGAIGQLPNFLRLLYGLLTDSRVDPLDKALVAGAIGYVIMPMDLIPDFIPFIGEVDDVFVLMLAIRRLMEHAGTDVLLDHWMGDPDELADMNVQKVLGAAAFFLPRRLRRRLRTIGRV